ncbi:MAG: putative HTH binding protein [Prokaryotic dsDNA virus sp.]|nr:MAG: putative HTH binding protein [Prokaryotic dsDNA virus sp.]|tara:strand:- start:878 stop:1183 length:306 start_codon:yes stop_codon:yes gene_type:complete
MAKNYHNTTNLTGSKLKKAIDTSLSQESVILEIFKQGKKYSPSQVNKIIRRECLKWPLTSVRRAISNLTYTGHLLKTEDKVLGEYGSPEYVWKYNGPNSKN